MKLSKLSSRRILYPTVTLFNVIQSTVCTYSVNVRAVFTIYPHCRNQHQLLQIFWNIMNIAVSSCGESGELKDKKRRENTMKANAVYFQESIMISIYWTDISRLCGDINNHVHILKDKLLSHIMWYYFNHDLETQQITLSQNALNT